MEIADGMATLITGSAGLLFGCVKRNALAVQAHDPESAAAVLGRAAATATVAVAKMKRRAARMGIRTPWLWNVADYTTDPTPRCVPTIYPRSGPLS